jgi:hypothetical protein
MRRDNLLWCHIERIGCGKQIRLMPAKKFKHGAQNRWIIKPAAQLIGRQSR